MTGSPEFNREQDQIGRLTCYPVNQLLIVFSKLAVVQIRQLQNPDWGIDFVGGDLIGRVA